MLNIGKIQNIKTDLGFKKLELLLKLVFMTLNVIVNVDNQLWLPCVVVGVSEIYPPIEEVEPMFVIEIQGCVENCSKDFSGRYKKSNDEVVGLKRRKEQHLTCKKS